MTDKLSIPKFVSFASGRVTRIAKDATETNFNLSCKRNGIKMTDKTDINATPRIAEEASNKTPASPQNRYTIDYALEQIETC
ncbi:MAG: hypothetical protein WCR95_08245 [Eubacteriales bacterium]